MTIQSESKTEAKPKAKPAAKPTAKPNVIVVRQLDAPPDNYPFSAETVIEQYQAYLEDMYSKGYQLGAVISVAVGSQSDPYLVFNKY